MQRLLVALAVAAASVSAMAADVGVSVRVGQPNFYGRIDIGEMPRPQVVYAQPIIVQPAPPGVVVQPIYLRVPPGHAKHWNKHCQRYNACGQPVYFVQESWYNNVYVPRYRVARRACADAAARLRVTIRDPRNACSSCRSRSVRAVVGASRAALLGRATTGRRGTQRRAERSGRDRGCRHRWRARAPGRRRTRQGHRDRRRRSRRGCDRRERRSRRHARLWRRRAALRARRSATGRPEYWDVSYRFRGVVHRAQLSAPPGATITVDARGQPRI